MRLTPSYTRLRIIGDAIFCQPLDSGPLQGFSYYLPMHLISPASDRPTMLLSSSASPVGTSL